MGLPILSPQRHKERTRLCKIIKFGINRASRGILNLSEYSCIWQCDIVPITTELEDLWAMFSFLQCLTPKSHNTWTHIQSQTG